MSADVFWPAVNVAKRKVYEAMRAHDALVASLADADNGRGGSPMESADEALEDALNGIALAAVSRPAEARGEPVCCHGSGRVRVRVDGSYVGEIPCPVCRAAPRPETGEVSEAMSALEDAIAKGEGVALAFTKLRAALAAREGA